MDSIRGGPSSNMKDMIQAKERELQEMNEYRIRSLENMVIVKEKEAKELSSKFSKLKEDFLYNLKLIEDRDKELEKYDVTFSNLKHVIRDKEGEISDLKVEISEQQGQIQKISIRGNEQESFFNEKLKNMRFQLETLQHSKEEEIRRMKNEEMSFKTDYERQIKQRGEDLEAQRREMTLTFDEVMRQQEVEFMQKYESLSSENRNLEHKCKELGRELEQERDRSSSLQSDIQALAINLQETQKREKTLRWEFEDLEKVGRSRISELDGEILSLRTSKGSLMEEYESKMAELLKSMHNVERAFVSQKEKFELKMQSSKEEHDEIVNSLTNRFNKKMEMTTSSLHRSEAEVDSLSSELRSLSKKYNDELTSRQREIDALHKELEEVLANKDKYTKEVKDRMWELDLACKTLREQGEATHMQLLDKSETVNRYKSELENALKREEELKLQIVNGNIRWEQRWTLRESEASSQNNALVKTLQQQRDRILLDNQSSEQRILELENELSHLRIKNQESLAQNRIKNSIEQNNTSKISHKTDIDLPSPTFTEDMGPASPLSPNNNGYFSPTMRGPPPPIIIPLPQNNFNNDFRTLREENNKLRDENSLLSMSCDRLKSVVAEMRKQMEEYIEKEIPQGIKNEENNKVMVLEKEIKVMEEQIKQSNQYVDLLQVRVDSAYDKDSIAGGEREEIKLLRANVKTLNIIISELRREVTLTQDKLNTVQMKLKVEGNFNESQSGEKMLESQYLGEMNNLKNTLISTQGDLKRLINERDKLLNLSNSLKSQLNRLINSNEHANTNIGKAVRDAENRLSKMYEDKIDAIENNLLDLTERNRALNLQLSKTKNAEYLDLNEHPNFLAEEEQKEDYNDFERDEDLDITIRNVKMERDDLDSHYKDKNFYEENIVSIPKASLTSPLNTPSIPKEENNEDFLQNNKIEEGMIKVAKKVEEGNNLGSTFSKPFPEIEKSSVPINSGARQRLLEARSKLGLAHSSVEKKSMVVTGETVDLEERKTKLSMSEKNQKSARSRLLAMQKQREKMKGTESKPPAVRNYSQKE